jgi:hypothetical protein
VSQIVVPAQRPYIGRHRWPDQPDEPDTRARDLAELEGTTRDLQSPAGLVAAARAVMGLLR